MKPEKQKEKARETMDIYSPIAQRLGISKIKVELDDLSLKYLHPDVYYDLSEKLAFRKEQRQQFVDYIIQKFSEHLSEIKIKFQINGRVKHLFSIYKKMVNQNKTLDQIYDVFAIRIIVEDVAACYLALGTAHEIYKPIPGRFKDYIAMPKPNMYQSLHTTLISDTGQPFEVQIRTFEMHKTAEFGIAAHWKYKESGSGSVAKGSEDAKMNWLRQILEWQKDTSDNAEYLKVIKSDLDLFSDSVYCFTPNGDVKNLPAGSNPIDFAYSIHSAVGNKMVGARVNGKLVNIDYPLKSGDRVEIITSQNSKGPSRDWLNIIKSNQARTKIQQWFKNELKEDNIIRGKELLEKYCKAKGINWPEINKPQFQEKVMKRYAIKDWDSILASLGHGGLKEGQVINKMQEEQKKVAKKDISESALLESLSDNAANTNIRKKSKNGITVKGIEDIAVRFSKCCNPVPGDEIVGFITRGRGVSIHRTDCINVMNLPSDDRTRLIPAEWQEFEDSKLEEKYQTELQIYAHNRTGLIFDIIKIFSENNITINNMNARTNKQDVSTINLVFDIKGREQLTSLIGKMRQIAGVIDIERATG
jgi:relA/spoT family protein